MASIKYSVGIGFLLLTVLLGSYVMMTMGDNLRIKVEPTMTTFQSYIDGSWQTAGIEKNALFNGTKSVIRNASIYDITYTINESTNFTTIKRVSTYKIPQTPTITDIYTFDGNAKDIELFPVAHKVIIENATGLIYQYQVTKLEYNGETLKDIKSPQSFGKNMKVEWEDGYYYSQIFKYAGVDEGKLTVKYRVTSNYEEYDVRLFDPVLPNLTIINTVNLAGNMSYDQLYVSSTGVINVNTTVGYLNITANNITILGQVNANGIGSAGASGACACDCSGGASSGSTGLGLGGGAAGGGASCYYCGGCASASDGGAATHTYGSATGFSAFMGSGGGSGGYGKAYYCSCSCDTVCSGSGGNGGGYLVLNGNIVNLQGATLSVNGAEGLFNPPPLYYFKFANGGAGSAGEILINGTTVNLNSATINTVGGTGASGGRTKVFYTSTLSKSGLTTNVGTSGTYYEELVNINITQISPANLNYTQSNRNTYNCTFNSTTGTPIYNIALNIYNTSGVVFNYSYINTSGFANKIVFVYNWSNYYINQSGKFNWTCTAVAKAYDVNSTGGTSGTLTNFNYSVQMEKGFEITQRIMYIDNYTFLANWSNTMVNNSWYNVNTTTNEVNISGVPTYNVSFVLRNSTSIVNTTNLTDLFRVIYYNLSDQYYNLSVNVTSCPLCQYTTSGKNYSTFITNFLFNIDTVMPIVNWTSDTTALNRTANFSLQNWIFGKINIYELNLKNVTFTVRNSTGVVNTTTYTY